MTLIASAPEWLFIAFGLVLLWGAVSDVAKRRIPNLAVLTLIIGAIVAVVLGGFSIELWQNVALFALLLALGTFSFSRGWVGGGDVKLLSASALWFSLFDGIRMIAAVFLVGGVLTLVLLMSRMAIAGSNKKSKMIPYGVAIAIGVFGTALWLRV